MNLLARIFGLPSPEERAQQEAARHEMLASDPELSRCTDRRARAAQALQAGWSVIPVLIWAGVGGGLQWLGADRDQYPVWHAQALMIGALLAYAMSWGRFAQFLMLARLIPGARFDWIRYRDLRESARAQTPTA